MNSDESQIESSSSFDLHSLPGGGLSRRDFLRLAAVGFAASYTLVPLTRAAAATGPFLVNPTLSPSDTFNLSVASGDPTPSGVVLWTRINPSSVVAAPVGSRLGVQVALDAGFTQLVLQARVPANQIKPELDNTVRIDLDGRLAANSIFYYRFIYNGVASRTGRCRTLPILDDSTISSLKFAVVNCQDYRNGYYPSYSYVANDTSIDFVLHVGDFIYENAGPSSYPDRSITLPSGSDVALGLADYRVLYQTYRSDPFLQQALENYTWMNIWDDHEMANDQYHDYAHDTAGAPDHPDTGDYDALRQLKLDSQQAWFEYNAARVKLNLNTTDIFKRLSIYRTFRFGTLVELFLTDERTYRSPHPDGEIEFGERYFAPIDPAAQGDPTRTMLGNGLNGSPNQRDRFIGEVAMSSAVWKAWANEVLLGAFQAVITPDIYPLLPPQLQQIIPPDFIGVLTIDNDAWDGYQADRTIIATALRDHNVQNFVALTGDLHSYVASYFKIDFGNSSNTNPPDGPRNVVGVEYMTPAITSANLKDQFGLDETGEAGLESLALLFNPHFAFFQSSTYGYATVQFTRELCEYTMYVVDKTVNSPDAPRSVIKRFQTPLNSDAINDVT